MQLSGKMLCLALFLPLAACASRSDVDSLQRDLEEYKGRLFTVEKGVTTVRTETKEVTEKGVQEVQKELEALRRGTADLQAAMDTSKVDVQALAGKIDDVAQAAKKPVDDLALLKEDTTRRLTAVEERLHKLEQGFDESQKKLAELAKAKETPPTPEGVYQQGQDFFKNGDTQKARELFTRFLEQYPKHQLAANARYWLGETYYAEKKFEQAILEYQQVIKEYPGKEKIPAAMLKQALAFQELGDSKSARYILKKLVEDFPLADETALAKEKLKEIK
jgi:tol-pal system protein YbgF